MCKPVNIAVLHARLRTQIALKRQGDELRSLARSDPLTALSNRRAFDETLAKEWRRCARNSKPLSLILADLDHFKYFNDHYGHQAGDECLRKVANALMQAARRPQDLVVRLGGEEFAILLPEVDLSGAHIVAHRVQANLHQLFISHTSSPTSDRITASIGVTSIVPQSGAEEVLLANADALMYCAKNAGRNQIVARPASF